MRQLWFVAASCMLMANARADEARFVPAAGSTLTYRLVTTTKTQDKTVVAGQIYAYVVASSNGTVAERIIKPIALLLDCRGGELEVDCARLKARSDVREDNGLTLIPIPAAAAEKLAAKSAFRLRTFVLEQRKAAYPAPNHGWSNDDFFNGDDPMIVENVVLCDPDALAAFTPLGKTPQGTVSCQIFFNRSGGGDGVKPISSNASMSLEIADLGEERVTLRSGEWDVRRLSLKQTAALSSGGPVAHNELQFSEKLGVSVKSRSTVEVSDKVVSETDSELIAVSP
jgi:hypothetical protein